MTDDEIQEALLTVACQGSDCDEPVAAIHALVPVVRRLIEQAVETSEQAHAKDIIALVREKDAAVREAATTVTPDCFQVIGSGYEAGFDAGYAKGFADCLNEGAGDPRVERIDAGFIAMHAATNGEYSLEDMIVIDALQAGREFAVRLSSRETHIQQLIDERAAAPSWQPITIWREAHSLSWLYLDDRSDLWRWKPISDPSLPLVIELVERDALPRPAPPKETP